MPRWSTLTTAALAASVAVMGFMPSASAARSPKKVIMYGGNQQMVNDIPDVGRLAIVRTYHSTVAVAFPKKEERAALNAGSTLLVSAKPVCSTSCPSGLPGWQDVAQGHEDSLYADLLDKMQQAAKSHRLSNIYFAFQHEPDTKSAASYGSPSDFVQAWNHLYQLATDLGATRSAGGNIVFSWILTRGSFVPPTTGGAPRATAFFPGSNSVGVVGADVFNFVGCQTNSTGQLNPAKVQTPAKLLAPLETWQAQNAAGEPLMLPEWGTVPTSALPASSGYTRDGWIASMTSYLVRHSALYRGSLYWNSNMGLHGTSCHFNVDGDTAALRALKSMADNSTFTRTPR